MRRLIRHRLTEQPSVRQLRGLTPAALTHGVTGQARQRLMIEAQQVVPGGETHSSNWGARRTEAPSKNRGTGNVVARTGSCSDAALNSSTSQAKGPVSSTRVRSAWTISPRTSRSCLRAWRREARASASGDLAPEQTRQGLPAVGAALQHQVGQQRQRLGTELGNAVPGLVGGEEGGPKSRSVKADTGWSGGWTELTYRGISNRQVGNHDLFTGAM